MISILQQVQFARFKPELNQVWIDLDQNLSFFKDIIQDQRLVWLPKLQAVFGEHMSLEINLVHQAALPELIAPVIDNLEPNLSNINLAADTAASVNNSLSNPGAVSKYGNKNLDFANQARWPKVKLVLDFFPGTLSEISE